MAGGGGGGEVVHVGIVGAGAGLAGGPVAAGAAGVAAIEGQVNGVAALV